MTFIPHPDPGTVSLNCAVITISDTRTPQTDSSGQLIKQLLGEAGQQIVAYTLIPDELPQIQEQLGQLGHRPDLDVIICNGGTGIGPRDTTYDAISPLLSKTLPGFGELFRFLSYQEIGSRAISSRAIAGVYCQKLVFSLPGSTKGVKLALNKLILPELAHLVRQLRGG